MFKKILCFFGIHDWEEVKFSFFWKIYRDVYNKDYSHNNEDCFKLYSTKICLKCGKINDEIGRKKQYLRDMLLFNQQKEKEHNRRKELALKLYNKNVRINSCWN